MKRKTPTGQAPCLIKYKEIKKLSNVKIKARNKRLFVLKDLLGYNTKSKYFFFEDMFIIYSKSYIFTEYFLLSLSTKQVIMIIDNTGAIKFKIGIINKKEQKMPAIFSEKKFFFLNKEILSYANIFNATIS